MKRLLYVLCATLLLLPSMSNAQQVMEGKVKLGEAEIPGFTAFSEHSRDEVEGLLKTKLTEAGIKINKKKNKFYTYNGILLTEISPSKVDLYYKVEKKKKKSVIYFSVSKGYDNYISNGSDAAASTNIRNFLAKIDATIAHNAEVKNKEEEMAKANKALEKEKADVAKAEEERKKKDQELEATKKGK